MGKSAVHTIVSNVDAIIILKNPCLEFAKWGEPPPSTAEEIKEATRQFSMMTNGEKGRKKAGMDKGLATDEHNSTAELTTSSDKDRSSLESTQQSTFGTGTPKVVEPSDSEYDDSSSHPIEISVQKVEHVPQVTMESTEEVEIRFRVCAGNLMSASPWFDRVLKKNGWMESKWNLDDKCYHIFAQDWDEESFRILMDIFHLQTRRIPRTVTLETLAKVAILADYYECGESIELFTDMWIADLKAKLIIPTTYCRDLILWIWVSYIFNLSELFEQTTAIAIKQCTEPCRNLGLPIPAWITDGIDLRRYQVIDSTLSTLYTQLDLYRSNLYICPYNEDLSFRCGSMLFGQLTKEMDSADFELPKSKLPFFGQSLYSISGKIGSMKAESWIPNRNSWHNCNLAIDLKPIVDSPLTNVNGLSLRENSARNGSAN